MQRSAMTAYTFVFCGDPQHELKIGICAETWKLLYWQSFHCSGRDVSNRKNESAMVVMICAINSNQRAVRGALFEEIKIHGYPHIHFVSCTLSGDEPRLIH